MSSALTLLVTLCGGIAIPESCHDKLGMISVRDKWASGVNVITAKESDLKGPLNGQNIPIEALHELFVLRSEEDMLNVLTVFSNVPRLSFPGDIIQMLLRMKPYPVPASRVKSRADLGSGMEPTLFHDLDYGYDLPDESRRWELDTDWGQMPAFKGIAPPTKFLRILDQICAGTGTSYLEHSGTLSLDGRNRIHPVKHPHLFQDGSEELPLAQIAALCEQHSEDTATEILKDWGIIMRSAWSHLSARVGSDHPELRVNLQRLTLDVRAGHESGGGARRSNPAARPLKAAAYQQAALAFLVQRLGRDRLAGGARWAADPAPEPHPGSRTAADGGATQPPLGNGGRADSDAMASLPAPAPFVFGNTVEVASAECR
jgi:hypothetical protein